MTADSAWTTAPLKLERSGAAPLTEQIAHQIEAAIRAGELRPGGRLPSCRDFAVQLGVARGTVKGAYDRLIDKALLVAVGAAGTRVADRLPAMANRHDDAAKEILPVDMRHTADRGLVFQMGVPAHDAFPATLWARLHRQAVQAVSLETGYPDPRGLAELRSALAAHVTIARGIECSAAQILVTSGFRNALAIVLRAIDVAGGKAWTENPGYPAVRQALHLSGYHPVAVPVDAHGLHVGQGIEHAPDAALAIVTPGQQAPTGVELSPERRRALLHWAGRTGAWILEDDYLSELQLSGRAARALAAEDPAGRAVHIGSFSKTLSPALGIGFLVMPMPLARRLVDVATWLGAPPNVALQHALARFLREGHYLRHLRRMKRLYADRRALLLDHLAARGVRATPAGLAVMLDLPDGIDDWGLVDAAPLAGLGPAPMSPWFFAGPQRRPGLLLGVTNVLEQRIARDCDRLFELIRDRGIAIG